MRSIVAHGLFGLPGIGSCLVPMLTAADVTVTDPLDSDVIAGSFVVLE